MSVYFKFNSELNYSHVDFDGLHISVSDLKKSILHQKRLGKATNDFDLMISNAQTKEEYRDEQCLIPKNTSLIVARIPLSNQHKKPWEQAQNSQTERAPASSTATTSENINHANDISRMNGSEEDKIQAMMMQSTLDYDPTNYQRVRGINQSGEVPPNYRCHKCHKPGHWIKNCPQNIPGERPHHFKSRPESKKMTGIPRSLRENIGSENHEPQFVEEKRREVPEDLICAICKGIFKDAVMIPCCGSSFCDECVRTALLESEDNECPDCKEKGTSPGSLIPNRFLRNAVVAFQAESSNVLSRESVKKPQEEEEGVKEEEVEESTENVVDDQESQLEAQPQSQDFIEEDHQPEEDEHSNVEDNIEDNKVFEKDSESDEDDDNITVTVPPAHQQSRGATFRDSRVRRIPSHGVEQQFSHSKSHQEDSESFEEESNTSGRQSRDTKRPSIYESNYEQPPQGISSIASGEEKTSYHSTTSSHGSQHHYQDQQQPQNYNSNMMPQMHQHSMYPQGHYHQQQLPSGPYYPTNQMRPMRYEHQGNYPHQIRHHHVQQSQMMRPMHDNYGGMRHQSRPVNHLATQVTQNIQQRYGTGYIDDPLEAFNRIMREKEMRKERYRRSPVHGSDRRSRSFERKYSPMDNHNRRGKNYPKRKRSRSFKSHSSSRSRSRSRNRSMRGRSKSRSYSPRYRRKENVGNKDRRDERSGGHHRSPARRGGNHTNNSNNSNNNRSSRGNYKESLAHLKPRETSDSFQYHENHENIHEKNDQNFDPSGFDAPHSLEEQPPPPGDESEAQAQPIEVSKAPPNEVLPETMTGNNKEKVESSFEVNGSKAEHHHHHHKKSRGSKKDEKEASSDDKKSRDKKKRKKSKEHEKKKSKKDRKDKKVSGTPEVAQAVEATATPEIVVKEKEKQPILENQEKQVLPLVADPAESAFNRSDSILDINLEDEWIGVAPEVSKWEREETNKSLEASEVDVEVKKVGEEKVTSEVIKRAEHVLFTKAISAIRPKSPVVQVTLVDNVSTRSVDLKGSIKNRLGKKITEKSSRSRTPPIIERSKKRENSEHGKGKQLSSCIRVTNDSRRVNDRQRTRTPEERRQSRRSRTPEKPRQKPIVNKSVDARPKQEVKKHSRSSSSSSASTANSGETSKRHSKLKVKKRSRSHSADSSSANKRKKSKKDKKSKKKKKSRKPEKEKSSDTRRERD